MSSHLESRLMRVLNARRKAGIGVIDDLRYPSLDSPSKDFFSNDFLSLSASTELRSQLMRRILSAPKVLGARGSRILDGNTDEHVALETRLTKFYGAPALLFNSGYDANSAIFSALPQQGDVVVYDELIHASVHDGMKASRASKSLFSFAHNSIPALESILQSLVEQRPSIRSGQCTVFVAIESIYSMEGDCAPLVEIVETVQRLLPPGTGQIVVDEAHSTGLFGACGRGLVSELGLEQHISMRLHTFGKAMATTGAVVVASPTIRAYLINHARPFIFSTAMTRLGVLSIQASFDMLESGEAQERFRKLQRIIKYTIERLSQELERIDPLILCLLCTTKEAPILTPIIPLITPHSLSLAQRLKRSGYSAFPIIPPAVPRGKERLRFTVHADNTPMEVDNFIAEVASWARSREWEIGQRPPTDRQSGGEQVLARL